LIVHERGMTAEEQRPTPVYIDTPEALRRACQRLAQCKVLCVDTEFHRENTYYPRFALLQIASGSDCFLIDPLVLADLSPLWKLMHNPGILKVFHAARQDAEIILKESGGLPLPLFDTQVAAALLGYGQQVGFGNLVRRLLGKTLPKAESFTDWLARPLRPEQLRYAADDVIYLMPVYRRLKERLEESGRLAWLQEELAFLCEEKNYVLDPREAFWRVKGANKLKAEHLAVLRELAAWRELQAQKRDIPRRRLVSDECLLAIARKTRLSCEQLGRIRGLSSGTAQRFGRDILAAWERGRRCPEALRPHPKPPPRHSIGTDMRMELLAALVRLRAEENRIAANILASRQDIAALASWANHGPGNEDPPDNPCLRGWRRRLIGDDILRMLNGELCLRLDAETKLPVIETPK